MKKERRVNVLLIVILLVLPALFSLTPRLCNAQTSKDDIRARLEKAIAAKAKVDEAIAVLQPVVTPLQRDRDAMEASLPGLRRLKDKMHAIQTWNAFVATMSVTNDVITKASCPAEGIAGIITGLGGIVSDRALGELPGGPDSFKMKVKSLSETAVKRSGKLEELQKTLRMTATEVAQRMVDEGYKLDEKPLIRAPFTKPKYSVELLSESLAVVTGKNRFIQDAIGPAIQELQDLVKGHDELLGILLPRLKALKEESRRLAEEIHDWKRQLEFADALEAANEAYKSPPPNTLDPYRNSQSLDCGAATALADQAWDELQGCKIDGETYLAKVTLARNGVSIKTSELIKPYEERYAAGVAAIEAEKQAKRTIGDALGAAMGAADKNPNNWYWNPYVGMVRKNTPDVQNFWKWVYDWRAASNRWWAEENRLLGILVEARDREWDACNKCLDRIENQKKERYKTEGEALVGFLNKLKMWEESTIDIEFRYYWSSYSGTSEKKSYPLRSVGYTGEGLASSVALSQSRYIKTLMGTMGIPSFGSIVGAKTRSDTWLAGVQKASETVDSIVSSVKSSENTASGLASESRPFASTLEPKVEVWRYVRGYPDYTLGSRLDTRADFPRLKAYQEAYLVSRAPYMSDISDMDRERYEMVDRAKKVAEIISREKTVVDAALKTLEAIQRTNNGLRTNIDAYGTSQMATLRMNGISEEVIEDLEKLIADFASPEKLTAHVLMLVPGEKEYNRGIRPILPKEVVEALRRNAKSRMAAVAANRDAYETAYKDYMAASDSLDATLESMQNALMEIAPHVSLMLNRSTVLMDVKRSFMNDALSYVNFIDFYPPNPDDFADPNYGVMARLEKYEQLAEKYHSFIDPELRKIARSHKKETRMLNDMADIVDREGPGWMALGNKFSEKINEVSHTAWMIITPISMSGESEKGSPVLTAYNRVITSIMNIASRYYAAEALKALIDELSAVTGGVKRFLTGPETFGGVSSAKGWIKALQKYADPASSAMRMKSGNATVSALMDEVNRQIPQLQKLLDAETAKIQATATADIKAFYDQFKSAYESRNDALLMSFISGEWQAGDGSTLTALQTNLRRIFRMFDEIKYNMQNLVVTLVGEGRYNVSYDVTITSKIYKRNLKHEEKSTIKEEVVIGANGKARISKTLGGQFWYTQ